jgi:hypothetical protein
VEGPSGLSKLDQLGKIFMIFCQILRFITVILRSYIDQIEFSPLRREKGYMAIVRVRKDVTLWGKSGEMAMVRVRKCHVAGGKVRKWL